MMIFWTLFLGLPLLAFGGACILSRECVIRFVEFVKSSRKIALALTTVAWLWTTYEIMTLGVNMFNEFFVGVPVLSQIMMVFAFLNDHFYILTPLLIYLTFIWMPKSLSFRAFTGILMLIPGELFKTTFHLLPESGFAPIQIFVATAYVGAIIGMYGMFYPWRLETAMDKILSLSLITQLFGITLAILGLALLVIGFTI